MRFKNTFAALILAATLASTSYAGIMDSPPLLPPDPAPTPTTNSAPAPEAEEEDTDALLTPEIVSQMVGVITSYLL